MNKEDYNKEPIHFCEECLSPAIEWSDIDELYQCNDCGSIVQVTSSLEVWEDKFASVYGKSYLCISKEEFKNSISI